MPTLIVDSIEYGIFSFSELAFGVPWTLLNWNNTRKYHNILVAIRNLSTIHHWCHLEICKLKDHFKCLMVQYFIYFLTSFRILFFCAESGIWQIWQYNSERADSVLLCRAAFCDAQRSVKEYVVFITISSSSCDWSTVLFCKRCNIIQMK